MVVCAAAREPSIKCEARLQSGLLKMRLWWVQSRIECVLTIEDEQPGVSCRQTLEGEVEFKLLGLGHLAQRIVVDNLEKVYQGMPLVVQR